MFTARPISPKLEVRRQSFFRFAAALSIFAIRQHHVVKPLLHPSSANDLRPLLRRMSRRLSVVYVSFRHNLDWSEPHSFHQLLRFMLHLCTFSTVHILCIPHWRLFAITLLKIYQFIIPRSLISRKTAPASPLTFVHEVAS